MLIAISIDIRYWYVGTLIALFVDGLVWIIYCFELTADEEINDEENEPEGLDKDTNEDDEDEDITDKNFSNSNSKDDNFINTKTHKNYNDDDCNKDNE